MKAGPVIHGVEKLQSVGSCLKLAILVFQKETKLPHRIFGGIITSKCLLSNRSGEICLHFTYMVCEKMSC